MSNGDVAGVDIAFEDNSRKSLRIASAGIGIPFSKMRNVFQDKTASIRVQNVFAASNTCRGLFSATRLCKEFLLEIEQ